MNEALRTFAEAAVALAGTIVGSLIRLFDNNPGLTQWLYTSIGIAALFIAAYAVVKIIAWMYRKIRSMLREIRFRIRRSLRMLDKIQSFRRLKGKFMAKYKHSVMADRFDDVIFAAELENFLSNQEGRRLRKLMGKALGLPDLVPRPIGRKLVLHFKGGIGKGNTVIPPTYKKLAGPKEGAKLGPKPGEGVDIQTVAPNVVHSATLERLRLKKTG